MLNQFILYVSINICFHATGTLKFYLDGVQSASTFKLGQVNFDKGLDRVRIGYYAGYINLQSIASIELYLQPLSQAEVAASMARSPTYPMNPICSDLGYK